MDIRCFSADAQILPELAKAWVQAAVLADRDISSGTIFVPSRRAARALSAAFLPACGLRAVVLPKIVPLNAIDESALFFSAGLRLPPAISEARRLSVLSALILKWNGREGAPETLSGAMRLARDLASLMDEATRWEVNLHVVLPDIVAGDLAEHWRHTVEFLSIVTQALPAILQEEGSVTGESRRIKLMDAQIARWAEVPPSDPIWIAGVAFATPPLERFVGSIAQLPGGRVYLSAFDPSLSVDVWETIAAGGVSPHLGFKRLLQSMAAAPGDVTDPNNADLSQSASRGDFVRAAFLPSEMLSQWQSVKPDTTGLKVLSSQDEFEEARAIAAALRDAVETPGRTAALVTPDRIQATRVAAELERLGIATEDSAGLLLGETPPAVFLRLVAEAFVEGFTPISLISLMSHPFFVLGYGPARTRKLARSLEMDVIRPIHPAAGLDQIELSLAGVKREGLAGFVSDIAAAFGPLLSLKPEDKLSVTDIFSHLVKVADALSGGGEDLWSGDTGGTLSAVLTDFVAASEVLPPISPFELLDVLLAAIQDVRMRRPRNNDAHARVAIWGVLEARLQSVDALFVGGLIEGVFPAMADPGPWFSRPMRRAAGLPCPEDAIAEAAHDFISMILASREVVLCVPKRVAGAPAVPSRFVARLEALAEGTGPPIARHDANGWVRLIDTPVTREQRPRPAPVPPAWARPNKFSVSDITTLMNDPYAIYAHKILKISDVNPLIDEADVSLFGTIVHDGIAAFLKSAPDLTAADAPASLFRFMADAFPPGRPSAAVRAWWMARLKRLCVWLVEEEADRLRILGVPQHAGYEVAATWEVQNGKFLVTCRADRIEARRNDLGEVAISLIDYKTGKPPTAARVETGGAPQLIIEAVMAQLGCFGEEYAGTATEIAYWHLSGGAKEGKISPLFGKTPSKIQDLVSTAIVRVPELLERFSRDDVAFLDRPHPGRNAARRTYSGVSRRAEWDVNA